MRSFLSKLRRSVTSGNPLIMWMNHAMRMRKFVKESCPILKSADVPPMEIGIVVVPWCGSTVPWVSTAVGMLLGMRGHNVTFIVDDLPFGAIDRMWWVQLFAIRVVMSAVKRRHRIVHMNEWPSTKADTGLRDPTVDRLAQLNSVWALKGEAPVTDEAVDTVRQQLNVCDRRIGTFLRDCCFDLLFVPGGIWGSSGLWLRHAQKAGIRVSTYDSGGYGVLLLSVDGVACQLQDIPRAFRMLKEELIVSKSMQELVRSTAKAEMDKRRNGSDKFSSQISGSGSHCSAYDGGVVIALNSSWDSAALGLHAAFDTTHEWLVQTVRHLLEKTSAPVIVRQHPVERLPIASSTDNYGEILKSNFGDEPRLHFISAHDPVNSYDLMEQVCAVVVYTSTVGVEAAAQGKVVVTEARSYYANLGFVYNAETRERYFQLLEDAIAGRLKTTPEMQGEAIAAYYITQCCNWVQTPLTVPDFPQWSRRTLPALAVDPAVRQVVDAIERNIPVAYLNHRQNMTHSGGTQYG